MSALGSSVISKSAKKFAPKKAPARRPVEVNSTQTSTASSVERQIQSQTPQPHLVQSRITASPIPSILIPVPVPNRATPTPALNEPQLDNRPTPILIPSRDPSISRTPSAQSVVLVPQKSTLDSQQALEQGPSVEPPFQATSSTTTAPLTPVRSVPPVRDSSAHTRSTPLTEPTTTGTPPAKRRKVAGKRKLTAAFSQTLQEADPNIALPTTETVDGLTGEEARSESASTLSKLAKKAASLSAAEKRKQQTEEAAALPLETTTGKTKKPRKYRGTLAKTQEVVAQASEDADQDPQEESSQTPAIAKLKRPRKSAKAKGKQAMEDAAGAIVEDAVQGSSKGLKKRGRRSKRAVTPDEAEHVQIDIAETRMSDLCRDGGTGQKHSAHEKIRANERAATVKKKQEALQRMVGQEQVEEIGESRLDRVDREKRQREEATANIVPQQRIVNGEIVLDTSTLRIDRHAIAAVERDAEQLPAVEEDEYSRKVNNSLGLKRDKSGGWNEALVDRFYNGLRMFGTDFGMICKMFPGKTRHAIKLKFCREEKEDYPRIRAALLGEVLPVELEEFQKMTGEEYEDPAVLEKDIEEDKKKLEEEQEQEKEAIEAARRERAEQAEAERLAAQEQESSSKENRRQRKRKGGKGRKRKDKGEKVEKAPPRSKARKGGMLERVGEGATQQRVADEA